LAKTVKGTPQPAVSDYREWQEKERTFVAHRVPLRRYHFTSLGGDRITVYHERFWVNYSRWISESAAVMAATLGLLWVFNTRKPSGAPAEKGSA